MTRLLLLSTLIISLFSCSEKEEYNPHNNTAMGQIESWETLGSQTLVIIDLYNNTASQLKTELKIKAVNNRGNIYTKDTTILLESNQNHKQIQVLMTTDGDIKKVDLTTSK